MTPEEARQKLLEMFGNRLVINKEFDKFFNLLKEGMQEDFLKWCEECKQGKAKGSVPLNSKYKDRFVFFRKTGGDVRSVLIKIQNSDFIELYLIEHKEYDDMIKIAETPSHKWRGFYSAIFSMLRVEPVSIRPS